MGIFRLRTFCIFFSIMVTIQFFVCAQDIKYILSTMPTEDKEALTRLFYWMMRNDNLSYTLFGNKPISLSGDFDVNSSENLKIEGRCSRRFWNYWQIWEKYEKNFQIQNYLLIKEKSITVSNVTNVVFINKKAFINIFNKHAKIFNKILNKHLTSDSLLKEIEDNRKFAPIIKNNEILWGILLGYGVHNAKLYDKKYKLERFIYFDELPKIPLKKPSPSKSFSSIEEELDFIELKTEPFGEYGYSPIIQNAVHFMVNPEHPETKALEKKYQKLRSKISAIYAQGDFLEITLSKLTSKE